MNKVRFLFLLFFSTILISQNLYSVQGIKPNEVIQEDKARLTAAEKTDARADDSHFPVKFREVWGYLMRGEEKVFKGTEPVTDVCYFSCGINSSGRINVNVTPPVLPELNGQKRRMHMVIADLDNTRMMTYILDPDKEARNLLVNDIIEVSKKFDGVQIDFEAVATKDSANFLEFLRLIKAGLEPGKTFSIALPAKVIKVDNAYDYKAISAIVDKVFIMAYDQHWSTSKPGPVASLSWCRDIINYAITEIPPEKLIMGIPLYGRSWKKEKIVKKVYVGKKHAKNGKKNKKRRTRIVTKNVIKSRSVKTNNISSLIAGKNIIKEYSPEAGFKLEYGGSSKEILYCDDVNATMEKFLYYREHVDSIGFWRLGMESPDMWKEITIINN